MDNDADDNGSLTSRSLLLRLRADGPEREIAWQNFHACYAPMIGGFARRMGAKPQMIADLVQTVVIGFFKASPDFKYDPARGRFRGYLKTCTWRVLREQFAAQRGPDGQRFAEITEGDARVDPAWNDVWETETLQRALETVREQCQATPAQARAFQAFSMYVLLERSPEEVAHELGVKVDSVYQAKTRITRQLKQAMSNFDAEMG